MVQRSELTGL